MVTPQQAYDSIKGKVDDMVFTGFCKDYLDCWVFPYVPQDGNGLGGFCFIAKKDGKHVLMHPFFRMSEFIKAPDVSNKVKFENSGELSHSAYDVPGPTGIGKQIINALLSRS